MVREVIPDDMAGISQGNTDNECRPRQKCRHPKEETEILPTMEQVEHVVGPPAHKPVVIVQKMVGIREHTSGDGGHPTLPGAGRFVHPNSQGPRHQQVICGDHPKNPSP